MDSQLDAARKMLGIPANSDRETLTSAYRRHARATHPDVSPEPDAGEQFAAVTGAYRLLTGVPAPIPRLPQPAPWTSDLRGVPLPLRRWPTGAGSSWGRSPIVAGPVMVHSAQPGRRMQGA